MCGICGAVSFDGEPAQRHVLERMTAALRHRGPDSSGVHLDGAAGLGATRLAILDLARAAQPMLSADGQLCVVHNGEIYDHARLRRDLEASGHSFRTSGDTEVVLELYRRHGEDFPRLMRGMFATAVWDAPARRLVLARDRFGIKPLFYRLTERGIQFASELRSLRLYPGFDTSVCATALRAYLEQNSIPGPMTIFREARKLEPGHVLVCEDGRVRVSRFARPRPAAGAGVRRGSMRELAVELRERLEDSVQAHLVSDVPVGVLLSGGVDSSLLTALAAQHTSGRLRTYSIGFREQSFDELGNARAVAQRYGTDHSELVLEPDAAERLPAVLGAFDEPFGDSSALPTYLVAEMAAREVKVVLSGEGADELFGGYETYVADLLAQRLPPGVARLEPLAERLPSSDRRVSVEYRAKRFLQALGRPPLERHQGWKEIFGAGAAERLLCEQWHTEADPLAAQRARFADSEGAPLLARLQDVDLAVYLVDDLLVKTDRMSMAHGLEARVPFLDTSVAELAMALPTAAKVRGWQKKRLLREVAAELLPRRIVRGRKRGFSIPAAAWLRGELAPFAREALAREVLERHGFFQASEVDRLLGQHTARVRDNSRQLWGLISFTLWQESLAAERYPGTTASLVKPS